ncbi:TatD family hydrolase [Candidatus Nitrosacidococcus tergens]|uniref:Putative metallodependent hydrolase n=1 Tax=Candidatus Nitrosacidococcus tergens TaxID=553981 RepID=A0A7G1QAA5_9GAMM|nr:TatD family hydrolase [Candidatus Nitrosacidococcus tergens]CAB1275917.1 putative metallodependent hydrolase [Candidatus Nitrosacidococcus tergens]
MLVDSHCHINLIDQPASQTIEEAHQSGVGHMLCVSVDMKSFPEIYKIAQKNEDISISVGIHPNSNEIKESTIDQLIDSGSLPEVVGIGETGLDYFRSEGDLSWQQDRFRAHITAAKICNKPLIIHTRQAKEDTLRILKEEGAEEVGGVLHCFTEDWDTAKKGMDLGFYISFSGIITFPSARDLQQVATKIPANRLLIETDSPYLAPVPYRGKTNTPAYVQYVAKHIAELRKTSLACIEDITTENFFSLFTYAAKH